MWPVTPGFLAAIGQSYQVESRVELWYGNSNLSRGLNVVAGTVSASNSQVRRTLALTVTDVNRAARQALWQQVSLPGIEVRVFRGITFLDDTITEIPLGVFVVQTPKIDERSGVITFGTCPDRMQRVVNYTFENPRTSSAGFTYGQQIQQLIGQAVSGLSWIDRSGIGDVVPGAVWDSDRAGAVTDLATAVGCQAYFDPSGQAILAPVKSFSTPADWTIAPASNLVSAAATIDWTSTYNVVVAQGDSTDGTPPVYGVARDTNTASPTYWQGPLGPKTLQYSSPLLTSNTMAGLAAATILAKSTGSQKQIDLTTIANPALDVGDRVDVVLPNTGWLERHLVDTLSIDLTSAAMSITTRATGTTGAVDV